MKSKGEIDPMTDEYPIKQRWPLQADHITSDGSELGLTGRGIIPHRHLRGHQSAICDSVGYPTTIIEFSQDGEPVRTDSPFLKWAIHPACELFRKENLERKQKEVLIPGALCLHCDRCHAELFKGLTEDELSPETIRQRKESNERLKELYEKNNGCSFEPKIHEDTKRVYLQYDCPLLGFRELLFPIVFEERVLAVFFVGQLTLNGQEAFIVNMIKSIRKRYPDCFAHSGFRPKSVPKKILAAHKKWIKEDRENRIIESPAYRKIISKTIEEMQNFENSLHGEMSHGRHSYIRDIIAPGLQKFSKLKEYSEDQDWLGDAVLKDLWNNVQDTIDNLVNSFSLRFSLVFGASRTINTQEDILTVQAKTPKWSQALTDKELHSLSIDCTMFPRDYCVCTNKQVQDKEYINVLFGVDLQKLGDFQLIFVPVRHHPDSSIAVLLAYAKKAPSSLLVHAPEGYLHNNALRPLFTLVVSALTAMQAKAMEQLAKKQLLYLGHEAGQLASGLDWLSMRYEKAWRLEKNLRDEHGGNNALIIKGLRKKIEDLCADMTGNVGQLSFVFKMAEKLGSNLLLDTVLLSQVDPKSFQPFGDVLFKWRDTYREECERKKLQMHMEFPNFVNGSRSNDPWRPTMYADKYLFEQVVYNLVDNAEKYCHRGTKIDINCKLVSCEEGEPYVLTVTDYGRCMDPEDKDVFLPFQQGELAGGERPQGLGLGLYIVWVIVEHIHGGKVEPQCDVISEFNVPLIAPYIERTFDGKENGLREQLKTELDRLKRERLYDGIVAYEPETESTLASRLCRNCITALLFS